MALGLTIGGNNVWAYVNWPTIRVTQEAGSGLVATFECELVDNDGSLPAFTETDEVIFTAGATTLFAGFLTDVNDGGQPDAAPVYRATAQSADVLLDLVVVTSLEAEAGNSDSSIISSLFTNFPPRVAIDVSTYVSTLDASMEAFAVAEVTLRRALQAICERTGGYFYVKRHSGAYYLHYYSAEANAAAWGLSDAPDNVSTFGYSGFKRRRDATGLVNRWYIVGNNVSGWVEDAASVATYGAHEAVHKDNGITTAQGVTDVGTALLAGSAYPRGTYSLTMRKDGLEAGMDVDVTNGVYGLSAETLTIRRMTITPIVPVEGSLEYQLELGDVARTAAGARRSIGDRMDRMDGNIGDINDDVFDTTPPSAPTLVGGNLSTGIDLDADGHQAAWLQVTWGSVSDADLDHYEVQVSEANDFSGFIVSRSHPADGDRVERFFPLVAGTTYYVRVRAVDVMNNYSAWSDVQNTTTAADTEAPAAPANLSAAGVATGIHIVWDRNSEADFRYYTLQRAPDVTGSPGTYATIAESDFNFVIDKDFTDANIEDQDEFWYRVAAVDASGNVSDWTALVAGVAVGQVVNEHIAAATITGDRIAANTITAGNIFAATITATEIAASTITADRLNVGTLSAISADMGTLTAGEIRVGTGTVGVNFTGFRIYSTYIGGFSSDVLQAGIRASDGKIVAGATKIIIDADAFIKFTDGEASPTTYGKIGWYNFDMDYAELSMRADKSSDYGMVIAAGIGLAAVCSYNSSTYRCWAVVGDVGARLLDDPYIGTEYARIGLEGDGRFAGGLYVGSVGTDPAADWIYADGGMFIGDTANANMTMGLTVNQGANDNELLAGKSSDVAHGMTSLTETDTYFTIKKHDAAAGGCQLAGYRDADGASDGAMVVWGYLGEAATTTKSTAGWGIVVIGGSVKSGTSSAAPGADANLVSIASGGNVRFIFDQEGEMHSDDVIGDGSDWDEWDDLALAADLSRLPRAKWSEMLRYRAADFERAGLVTLSVDEEGRQHAFLRHKALLQFYACCFGEVHRRLHRCEAALLQSGGLG